jgi:hypothetical protein
MGRYVYDSNGEVVWKYVFAEQDSEQSRIAEELGIGSITYNEDGDGDVLRLDKSDIKKLKEYLDETIIVNFFGNEFSATRIECVKHWNERFMNKDAIIYNGFTDNVNKLINNLMNDNLNYWAMIYAYVIHMEKLGCDWLEFYGEY